MKLTSKISAPEAFYRLFQTLPAEERFTAARYILEDEEIRHHFKINVSTQKVFSKENMAEIASS